MIITARVALRIALLVLLFVVLQDSFFSMIEVLGASFWILPAAVAVFGLLGGSMVGATVGFVIGLLSDALTGGSLGISSLVLMGVGYTTGIYRERGDAVPWLAAAFVCGVATLAANAALGLFTVLLGFEGYLSAAAIPDLLLQGLYGFFLAIPVFFLVRRVLRPALVEERSSRRRQAAFEA